MQVHLAFVVVVLYNILRTVQIVDIRAKFFAPSSRMVLEFTVGLSSCEIVPVVTLWSRSVILVLCEVRITIYKIVVIVLDRSIVFVIALDRVTTTLFFPG